ncbi:MAG: putative aminotransferase [Alphaproteobacteria bacterium MarineAlpha5_Bin9]|nr:MAG: putative aminotransferase [Alphaproteobacteria bacterium MarineAlpha5_Bin9]|tara:strand:+ start:315 stop:1691 length:1377 start_codon:yes stop_codon:yes gene_type:complete
MKNDYISQIHSKDRKVLHPYEDLKFRGTYKRKLIVKSENIYLYDEDGNKYIDGPGGMWCNNIGHGNKEIAEAIKNQLEKIDYCSPFSESTEISAELASELAKISPGDLNTVFFTSDGSTANDSALRFVMMYNNILGRPKKKHIISRDKAYHGSTYLTGSITGKDREKNNFDFEKNFIHHLKSPNPYRRKNDQSVEEFCNERVKEFEDKILELGPENVAAYIAEPILASGGCIVPPKDYNKRFWQICKKYEVIYISDEVVTAFGRLGHFFSSEDEFEILPDIITTAKGITSGYFPLGAVLISNKLMEDIKKDSALFYHGYTYSGHPAACAAALKNIEILKRDKILENVKKISPYFFKRLNELFNIPIVGDVRGMGLMAGIECVIDKNSKNPLNLDKAIASRIDEESLKLGLIIRPLYHICVLSPALIITKEQVDDLCNKLYQAINNSFEKLKYEGLWSE